MAESVHNTKLSALSRRRLVPAAVVARMLGIPLSSVYDHARSGRLPGVVRIGRRVLFDLEALEWWVARGGETEGGPQ